MKYIQHILIIFAIMLTGVSFGQINLSDLNYVHTITPQQPVTIDRLDEVGGDDEPAEKRHIQQVTYYDGLGREMQSIGIKHNKDSKDIVTHTQYDRYGRQARQYLPFKRNTANGTYEAVDIDQDINSYYHTQYANDFPGITDHRQINAYSETRFESSPLNRALEQGAPGSSWKIGSDSNTNHTVRSDWRYNTANEVVHFRVGFTGNDTEKPTLIKVGYYAKNQLHVAITKDENYSPTQALANEHTVREYTNKQGQVLLKRTYASVSVAGNTGGGEVAHDTHYVYDRFGNLTFVIPPKVNVVDGISATELNELCYQYVYDNRNRLVEKKIPGKAWESIVYNKLDQPVLTQDALLKQRSQWLFTKYDAYGRVAYTGKITDSRDRKALQAELTGFTSELWVNRAAATTIGGVSIYYDNGGYPATQPIEVLTINYYDDYEFLGTNPDPKLANPGTVDGETILSGTKSLETGSLVKVMDTDSWITNVIYYDKKARPIYVATKNDYLSSIDVVETQLDFTGKVKQSTSTHSKGSNVPIVTLGKMTYDHVGRPLVHTQTINGHEELIAANQYDALGQLHYKNVGGAATGTGLQKVDYAYNIRGWLKTINEGKTDNGDLFGFAINYSRPTLGGTTLFNGNISETSWKTQSVNPNPPNNPISTSYVYNYDALSRITSAIDNTRHYNLSDVTYDKNGNIKSLHRKGLSNVDTNTFGVIDMLSYNYDSTSNKLIKVEDSSGNTAGFSNGVNEAEEYRYDANGNMIVDQNKGITDITYNHLNLPTKVTVTGTNNGTIEYIYDATGVKIQKIVEKNEDKIITDYIGDFVYKNGSLEFFGQTEGYITPDVTGYRYVYQFKDHLQNIRFSYTDADNNGTIEKSEIIEESNYYPFGLKHKGYNNIVSSYGNRIAQLRGFGEKEEQNELGLGWIDITARNYDPAIGRWMNLDPLAEEMRKYSPYNYAFDNPIYFIDPDGNMAIPASTLLNAGLQITTGILDEVVIKPPVYAQFNIPKYTFGNDNQYGVIKPAPDGAYNQDPVRALAVDISYGVLALTGIDAIDNLIHTYGNDNISTHDKVVATLQTMVTPGGKKGGGSKKPSVATQVINEAKRVHPNVDTKTLLPGPFAKRSIPARSKSQSFNKAERTAINEMGTTDGCHTCGSKTSGRKTNNFTPDHQPSSSLVPDGTSQQLYPHCKSCSSSQGGTVGGLKRKGYNPDNITDNNQN